jgi:DNA segregation ATPase FtsK/SpoIIIE, S-DNA-T family
VISVQLRREVLGIGLLLFAVFLMGAIVFPADATVESCVSAKGMFGPLGSCLSRSIVGLLGLPAALLLPGVPAVYALRLFGRIGESRDRSWLILVVGTVSLLPVIISLATGSGDLAATSRASGIWGSFVGYYLVKLVGSVGAWVFALLGASALTAATLGWNPIRMLVGSGSRPLDRANPVEPSGPAGVVIPGHLKAERATLLEPPPEEMPALEPHLILVKDERQKPDVQPHRPASERKQRARPNETTNR